MNFVGHIAVARAIEPDNPLVHLGAALPDLAAMARVRLTAQPSQTDVARGVALHYRTDDVFHGHELFLRWSKAVTTALGQAGVGRGAARACGHVGVELLLDGHWLATDPGLRSEATHALRRVADDDVDLEVLVPEDRRDTWRVHLERAATWPLPDDYRQPDAVAQRLQRILAARPRLAFDRADTAVVSAVLADHQIELEWGAKQLLADVVADSR